MNSGPMCLAVTFLLIGVGFAWPGLLWAWPDPSFSAKSVFTLNLFALTAYLGLSHFVYAFLRSVRFAVETSGTSTNAGVHRHSRDDFSFAASHS